MVLRNVQHVAASLLALSAAAGAGAANLLTNGSFETATGIAANATLAPGDTNLDGWTVIGGGNLLWCDSGSPCVLPASDGSFSLDLTGLTNIAPYAGVEQTIATVPGASYVLSFDLSGRSDSTPVSVLASAGATNAVFTNAAAAWATQSLSFVASASSTAISIVGVSAGGSGLSLEIDNVVVPAVAVPEPATAWLLAGGIILLQARRRRV